MDFPIPWDTIGNITTINFPERNGSTKFGAAPQAGTLWMHSITIPSFNYTGFNNIRYEKPNLTATNIPAVGCYYNLSSLSPKYYITASERTIQWWKRGESNITMQEQYIIKSYHIILVTYYHTPNIKTGKCQTGQHRKPKASPMLTGADDWEKILYLLMSQQDCHKSDHSHNNPCLVDRGGFNITADYAGINKTRIRFMTAHRDG